MPYTPSVQTNVQNAVTTGSVADLGRSMFIDTNTYHQARVTSYSSMTAVNADDAVPKNSDLYRALQNAFPNAGSRSIPIYVGRRQATDTIFTPSVADNTTYKFDVQVIDTTTQAISLVKTEITFTSGSSATATDIVNGLDTAITTAAIPVTDLITSTTGDVLTLTAAANRQVVITGATENLPQTFDSVETAAETLAAIQSENKEDWYYVTTSVRTVSWVLDMCDAIEATESSDFPKVFRTSSAAPETLIAQTDPSNAADLLGLMEDKGYGNCFGEWHDQSASIFPELASCVYYGSFFPGTQTWKFMNNCSNPDARHPVLGRLLTDAEFGFIVDRNAAVRGKEMGVSVYISGKDGDVSKGSGSWMDNLTISHWIRLNQKLRVFNALVNKANAGAPLTFKVGDRLVIKERAESVLSEAVERNMLSGFDPVVVPSTISFTDQATRTLKDITYTGYFAGKIHFVVIDGVLTYKEEV